MIEQDNSYSTLHEIRQRKLRLKSEITAQEKQIHRLWDSVFHSKEEIGIPTPSKRISSLLSTGAGIIDGAFLGWKLYRRFKGK